MNPPTSCESEKCVCGEQAFHKVGEEILFDDPLKHRHNLTVYVCCKHFQAIFGIAAQEVCGRHGHSDDSEPFEKLRSACGDVWDDVDVSKLMDELRPGAKSTE